MTGVNTNAVGARYAKVEVKYACAAQGWYVPTHVTLYDGARKVVSDTLTGDDPANWKAAEPGKPMDGVRPWACRA
jgi:hypothetical protein